MRAVSRTATHFVLALPGTKAETNAVPLPGSERSKRASHPNAAQARR